MKYLRKIIIGLIIISMAFLLVYFNVPIKVFFYEQKYGIDVQEIYQQHNALILEVEDTKGYTWYIFPREKYIQITHTPTIVNFSKTEIEGFLQQMRRAAKYDKIESYFPILDPHFSAKDNKDVASYVNLWVVFDRMKALEGEINLKSKKVIGIIGN